MKSALLRKIMFASKHAFFMILVMTCGMQLTMANYSNGQSLSEVSITIKVENSTPVEVFTIIETKTQFRFGYDRKVAGLQQQLTLDHEKKSLAELLTEISKKTRLKFTRINNSISVSFLAQKEGEPAIREIEYKEKDLNGWVLDENGDPLPGATVRAKNYNNVGGITDADGYFSFTAPDDIKTLVISFTGYATMEVNIGNQTTFNVSLRPDETLLEEVVVIGYGTRKKEDMLGSVSKVTNKNFKDLSVTSIDQGLVGQMAGVNVVQESGEPGSNLSFRIRGLAAISASAEPLIVLDGTPLERGVSLASIDPNTVESVDVLKDAAAASIYGSRGSNGVVLITTKRGKAGKTQFTFNTYTGFQEISNKIDMLDAYGHARYIDESLRNDWIFNNPGQPVPNNPTVYGAPDFILPYLNNVPGLTNTDWQDAIFRTAPMSNFELSARGGSEKARYFVSGSYFVQEGVIVNTDFERFALRANLDVDLAPKVRLGVNLAPSYSDANRVNSGTASVNGFRAPPVTTALFVSPMFPAYLPNGEIATDAVITGAADVRSQSNLVSLAPYVNPLSLAVLNDNTREEYRLLASSFLEYDVIPDLTLKSQISTDILFREDNYFKPSTVGRRGITADSPNNEIFAEYDSRTITNWTFENTLTYNKQFEGGHRLNVLAGYTAQKVRTSTESITANNFPNDNVQTLNAGTVTDGSTFISEYSLISQLARVTYDFENKYSLMASVRRDGSSRFGSNNRYGVFPAVSVGYRISEESFFPKGNLVNDLKLRASWGKTGNFFIPNHGAVARLGEANYPLDGNITPGFRVRTAPNPNLTWENTSTVDIGFDLSLLDGKVSIVADYYKSKTDDLLFNLPVPGQSGFTSTLQNVGSMESNGIELAVNAVIQKGGFTWEPGVNFSRNRHEVTNLNLEDPIINDWYWLTEEGGVVGAFRGYKALGIFSSQEQIDNLPSRSNAQVGNSYIWEDANGDGVINGNDRTVTGNPHPDYSLNFTSRFSYKGFDASFIVQSVQGFDVFWNAARDRFLDQTLWTNKTVDYANNTYQSPENPGLYPMPFRGNQPDDEFYRDSSVNIFDGSFVRVKNITLGYTLPESWVEKVGFDRVRIYFSGNNLFTFTDYPGYDPESSNHAGAADSRPNGITPRPGRDLDSYPTNKNYTFGINVNF